MLKENLSLSALLNWRTGSSFLVGCCVGGLGIGVFFMIANHGIDGDLSGRNTADQKFHDKSEFEDVVTTTIDRNSADRTSRSLNLSELAELNPLVRMSRLRVYLDQAGENELETLLLQTDNLEPKELVKELQDVIVEQFAIINPERAFKVVQRLQGEHSQEDRRPAILVRAIFHIWGLTNLEEAVQFAKDQSETVRSSAAEGILVGRDDLSPEDRRDIALQLVGEESLRFFLGVVDARKPIENPKETWEQFLVENRHQLSQLNLFEIVFLGRVAHALVNEIGLDGALRKIDEALPDGRSKVAVINSFLTAIAETDPRRALEVAIGIDDVQHTASITTKLAHKLALSDPEGAIQLVSSISASGHRNDILRAVIGIWIEIDAYAVVDNLELLPASQRSYGRENAIVAIAADSTEAASLMLPNIESHNSKVAIAEAIFSNWAKNDVQSAVAWLQNDPNIVPIKNDMLPSVVSNLAVIDPKYAMQLAQSEQIDEFEVGLETLVIQSEAERNVEDAIALLPEVRNEKTKASALGLIGKVLISNGEAERAIELADQLNNENDQARYLGALVPNLLVEAPNVFVENLESLPYNGVTMRAAQMVLSVPKFQNNLTDAQRAKARQYVPELSGDDRKVLDRLLNEGDLQL